MHSQSVTHVAGGCIQRELPFSTSNTVAGSWVFAALKGLPGCPSAAPQPPLCHMSLPSSSSSRSSLAKCQSSPCSIASQHKLESLLRSDRCTASAFTHQLSRDVATPGKRMGTSVLGPIAMADSSRENCQCFRSSRARGSAVCASHSQKESVSPSMDAAAENGADGAVASERRKLDRVRVIDFLTLLENLKKMKRTGWVRFGVVGAESIADHMYRMSIMSLLLGDEAGLDRDRCIKLAIVHDIAEAIVGDITPACGITKEDKSRMEKEAMDKLCGVLGGGPVAEEFLELWLEYEHMKTDEAKLIKDFDKLEMILQALEYEKAQDMVLAEFFESTMGKFQTDVGKNLALEIMERRTKHQTKHQQGKGSQLGSASRSTSEVDGSPSSGNGI
ncbi:hypothetical protein CBR_g21849 [Chara braunii]|uniref:5'-deoxynucleotidase n=1 Tax=Chara braunii TaxID=69332 RepID=A0A388JUL9_CHABU|nr:hypothetical protein CBR_g21849 [Chara braunii]|eukprot:GBG61506.1 hypothetical protein CBR_g21849 [Chara braunii]